MWILQIFLGCLAYAAALIISVFDTLLYLLHLLLRFSSNKCLSNGDELTGWGLGA